MRARVASFTAMEGTGQTDSTATPGATERELHEWAGYVRCELDAARAQLAALQQQQQELLQQRTVVEREVEALRLELEAKLRDWCELDDLDVRHDRLGGTIARLESVRRSLTFRVTMGLLSIVNELRWLVTFGWLRRRRAGGQGEP